MRLTAIALGVFTFAGVASAQSAAPTVRLTLENHRFSPDAFTVPAGRKVQIELINKDGAVEEFDSDDLDVEERVTPHGSTRFEIGPLKPGVYRFIGEFHDRTAKGAVTAK